MLTDWDVARDEAKKQAQIQEAVQIQRESKLANMQLRMRALEQEVEQHRFMSVARHREMAKLNALPCLVRADHRAQCLQPPPLPGHWRHLDRRFAQ